MSRRGEWRVRRRREVEREEEVCVSHVCLSAKNIDRCLYLIQVQVVHYLSFVLSVSWLHPFKIPCGIRSY